MPVRTTLILLLILVHVSATSICAESADSSNESFLSVESRDTYQNLVLPFLESHCFRCHDKENAEAGYVIDSLGTDFLEGKTADYWREAIHKINLGKMPPEGEARPDPQLAFAVVEWVNQETRNAAKRAQSTGGRVPMRRLNRTEYANTVRDLLFLDENFARGIERELPADGKVDGFDRGGAGLFVDKSQLQLYLDFGRHVVNEALPRAAPEVKKHHHIASEDSWQMRQEDKLATVKEVLDLGDIKLSSILDKPEDLERKIERGPGMNTFNVQRDGGLETSMGSRTLAYLQAGNMVRKVVTRDGWYRFRVRAGADRGRDKFATDAVRVDVKYCRQSKDFRKNFEFVIDAPLNKPQVYEKTVFLRAGGPGFQRDLTIDWNPYHPWGGYHDANNTVIPDPTLRKLYWDCRGSAEGFSRAMEKKESAEVIAEARKKRDDAMEAMRQFILKFEGPVWHVNADIVPESLPRLFYEFIEIEGPLTEYPTKASRQLQLVDEATEGDTTKARELFAGFLPRAFRRPVSSEEIEAFVKVVQQAQRDRKKSFANAMRDGVITVLTSPHFLYLEEPTGADETRRELTDYELASRLSYFLWSTMPDGELFDLAAQRKLRKPNVLRAQVNRMATDPKSRQFVENFVGQWTRAREFDSVMVDTQQYKNYDDALRESSLREPYEFFDEILRSDLSVLSVVDSDFVVINERLANHYGVDEVSGEDFRRVAIKPKHNRGGLLGMAGMLTFLADGSRTQPVRRGAYVLDVLWNRPPPLPPPNAGDLPVIKGKNLTVRQRLEQHRSVTSCAACHARIDPLGLALENYDAVGAWRERQNGERRRGDHNDPPIDPSGTMPDGEAFQNLQEFKQILMTEKSAFLNGFTEKLLAYALGRPVGATDRELIDETIAAAEKDDYRLQAFLQAVVDSRAFQTK